MKYMWKSLAHFFYCLCSSSLRCSSFFFFFKYMVGVVPVQMYCCTWLLVNLELIKTSHVNHFLFGAWVPGMELRTLHLPHRQCITELNTKPYVDHFDSKIFFSISWLHQCSLRTVQNPHIYFIIILLFVHLG